NVTSRRPNSIGISQFHSHFTTLPPRNVNSAIAAIPIGMINHLLRLMALSSSLREVVVDLPQPLAQELHRVALPREQRVHVHAGLRGNLLKTLPVDLVRNEDV